MWLFQVSTASGLTSVVAASTPAAPRRGSRRGARCSPRWCARRRGRRPPSRRRRRPTGRRSASTPRAASASTSGRVSISERSLRTREPATTTRVTGRRHARHRARRDLGEARRRAPARPRARPTPCGRRRRRRAASVQRAQSSREAGRTAASQRPRGVGALGREHRREDHARVPDLGGGLADGLLDLRAQPDHGHPGGRRAGLVGREVGAADLEPADLVGHVVDRSRGPARAPQRPRPPSRRRSPGPPASAPCGRAGRACGCARRRPTR